MAINLNTKPVYFFHIPKTSGRYFIANSFLIIENELIANDIQYTDILKSYGHRSFNDIDTKPMLSITFHREPVARTVSHWLHIYNNVLSDNIAADKKRLIDFLHANPTKAIIDYQTKYIAYNGPNEIMDMDEVDFITDLSSEDLTRVATRLSKVDFLFDMKNQSHELSRGFCLKLYDYFQLTPSVELDTLNRLRPVIDNPQSKILYNSLSAQEIQEIADLMPNDMNLYNTVSFTSL